MANATENGMIAAAAAAAAGAVVVFLMLQSMIGALGTLRSPHTQLECRENKGAQTALRAASSSWVSLDLSILKCLQAKNTPTKPAVNCNPFKGLRQGNCMQCP